MDRQSAVNAYNEWIEQVKLKIPSNQLLIHNAKDGWLPLCTFLELPDDQCPHHRGESYPHVNDTIEINRKISIARIVTRWFDFVLGLLLGLVIAIIFTHIIPLKKQLRRSVDKEE